LIAGLSHPVLAAAAHAWWLLGRIVYVRGYVTGKPQNRLYGVAGQLAILPLLFVSISTVYHLIK
jgi:glutathione S-transferase